MITLKIIVSLLALTISQAVLAEKFDLESYGAPTLYYSKEGIQQRQELAALNEANRIDQEQLDVDKARLAEQKDMHDKVIENKEILQ